MPGDSNCGQSQGACENFMAGTFEAAADCASEPVEAPEGASEGGPGGFAAYPIPAPGDGPITCEIAPGELDPDLTH